MGEFLQEKISLFEGLLDSISNLEKVIYVTSQK